MFECVPQAAENVMAKAVAGNPHNKQVVWSFVKDQFDRHPRVRTPEHDRKRMLRRRVVLPLQSNPKSRGSTAITRRARPTPWDKPSSNVAKA